MPASAIEAPRPASGGTRTGNCSFAPVKTGAEGLDGTVQILEGLGAGDEVVVYSERDLEDGSRITVVPSLRGAAK